MNALRKYFPILTWGAEYNRQTMVNDLIVAVIVTLMLIPQSLAYAPVAGLPPEVGLCASMLPLIFHAILGTSRALAAGPVAAGFITASGIQIAAGQLGPLLGVKAHGETFLDIAKAIAPQITHIHLQTAVIGVGSLVFLFWVRSGLKSLLTKIGTGDKTAGLIAKFGPVAANPEVRHVILECPAVNTIDISGLESLEAINARLKDGGITLHLSEVKGPVMDRLKRSHFLHEITGNVHLTHYAAGASINPELVRRTLEAKGTISYQLTVTSDQ